jgi:hypothetical protein
MNELSLFEESTEKSIVRAATMLSRSKVIPFHLQGEAKVADVFAILVMGMELGLKPMQALNSIHVIQGRATLSAQLMLSIVKKRCPDFRLSIKITGDQKNPVVHVKGTRHGGDEEFVTTWDMNRAASLGLIGKDNWKKQPLTMLQWRATSEVCRFLAPEAVLGIYTEDEAQDIELSAKDLGGGSLDDPELILKERIDHPEWYQFGAPTYKIHNAKYKGKTLQEIDEEELADYLEKLEKRAMSKSLKAWEDDVMQSIRAYLKSLDGQSVGLEDADYTEITTDEIPF